MTHLILAVLTACAVAAPAYSDLSDYLPLNVGNSWTYSHGYYENLNRRAPTDAVQESQPVTLRISRTQVIDGETYYVFTDFPGTRDAPPHTLFGKKVRWEGDSLMVHDGTSDYPLFRFAEISEVDEWIEERYSVDPLKAEGDTEVARSDWLSGYNGTYHVTFRFYGSSMMDVENPEYRRYVKFLRGYGMALSGEFVDPGDDYSSFINILEPKAARLLEPSSHEDEESRSSSGSSESGTYREIEYYDARR